MSVSASVEIRTWIVKLFDFYGKWMVLAEISIKLIFSQKERKAVCRFWLFKYILWPQWFAYELSLLQVYARKHAFLLSIYRSLLILCESWMRVSIVAQSYFSRKLGLQYDKTVPIFFFFYSKLVYKGKSGLKEI